MWVGRFIPAKNLPIKTRVDLPRLLIFLGRGGEGWYLFLRAINNANAGVGGLSGGGRWLGRSWGKGYQDSQCIFLISNTIQHVIVEMTLVQGNSVLQEKRL